MAILFIQRHNIFQQCYRICVLKWIADECECIHPLFLDFEDQRRVLGRNGTNDLDMCILKQKGKYLD